MNTIALTVQRRGTLALALMGATLACGQNAISAHSGMIHYVEGRALLDGEAVEPKATEFPEVRAGQSLATEQGRAEVLLTPGAFLRLSANSSCRMISNRLSDTSVEIVSGDALIEVVELLKDNAITAQFKGATARVSKRGLFRFESEKSTVRVFEGQISLTSGEQNIVAGKGKEVVIGRRLQVTSFDPKDTDPFFRWAERRSAYIATANVSAARQAGSMGLLANSPASWAYSPYYGMFTYLPGTGYSYSPFGWAFYSPLTVGDYFNSSNEGFFNTVGASTRLASTPTRSAAAPRGADTASSSSQLSGVGRSSFSGSSRMSSVAAHGSSGGGGHK